MWKKGLIAGLVILVIGFVINWLVSAVLPNLALEYQNPAVFRAFTDPLMVVYFAYPFILGVVAAYLWDRLKMKDPLEFAKFYFIIATIPGMFITYTSMQVSLMMVLVWAVTGFVEAWIAGYVFTKIR